jgi:hypothetical protein
MHSVPRFNFSYPYNLQKLNVGKVRRKPKAKATNWLVGIISAACNQNTEYESGGVGERQGRMLIAPGS